MITLDTTEVLRGCVQKKNNDGNQAKGYSVK